MQRKKRSEGEGGFNRFEFEYLLVKKGKGGRLPRVE